MANVQIRNLHKSYGKVDVLHGIDLDIPHQSFVVLVGPSGCGKSTLLRAIAGLEDISGGEIRIGDRVINDVAPKDRDIAMVFQSYALYPHMTVEQNMGFALKMAKTGAASIKQAVASAAETLNLTKYLDRYPRELSGGQRQRVAMGRCIVRNPQVFLFDEPLSNLDAKLRVKMRTEIKALHQRLNATSVYVTHDQMEAMTMADRIVVMRDGRIEQIGAPLELYDRPVNEFVASFMGSPSINLLRATWNPDTSGGRFELEQGLQFATQQGFGKHERAAVTLGVRPEHLSLVGEQDGSPAQVKFIEPTGNETIITADLAGQEIQISLRERRALQAGEMVYVRPQDDKLHMFDGASGIRLSA